MSPKMQTAAQAKKAVKNSVATTSTRVTRSSIRRVTGKSENDDTVAVPPPAPAKVTKKKKEKAALVDEVKADENDEKAPAEVPVEVPKKNSKKKKGKSAPVDQVKADEGSGSGVDEEIPAEVAVEVPKKKKAKLAPVDDEVKSEEADDADEAATSGEVSKTVVIEHCKQCNAFKTRAALVKEGLEKGVAGITVLVNPDKPRRGCFEIREEGGETFVSLLDMQRPFTKMKELDMNQVIEDIVEKIK